MPFTNVKRRLIAGPWEESEHKGMLDPHTWRARFVQNAAAWIAQHGMKRADVAKHFESKGVTRQAVYLWFRKGEIGIANLRELARFLRVDPTVLRMQAEFVPAKTERPRPRQTAPPSLDEIARRLQVLDPRVQASILAMIDVIIDVHYPPKPPTKRLAS